VSILIDRTTRAIVMGATGSEGSFWTGHMVQLGTQVVAAVTPGKEGESVGPVPVYHSCTTSMWPHGSSRCCVTLCNLLDLQRMLF